MSDTYQATQNNDNLTRGGSDGAFGGDGAGGTIGKDFENGGGYGHEHLHGGIDPDTALRKVQTAGSISISPELFEKIYLSPQNRVAGELRKTLGNPTPYALIGFLLSLTPLSCILMGWRGAGNNGVSDIGAYLSFGGILMLLGSIGEWILGNTFPSVVFGSFGAFWLTFGLTLYPITGAISGFEGLPTPDGTRSQTGLDSIGFQASFGFFLLWMGFMCFIFAICALRTNILFFLILLLLVPAFGCLAGGYWNGAQGDMASLNRLLIAAGAITFVVDMLGWYLFTAILLASLDFPIQLPVGDLSHIVKGANEKAKARRQKEHDV